MIEVGNARYFSIHEILPHLFQLSENNKNRTNKQMYALQNSNESIALA